MNKFIKQQNIIIILMVYVSVYVSVSLFPAEQKAVIRAGVHISPPFIMTGTDGDFFGMAIDIWENVAKKIGVETKYIPYRTVEDLLNALQSRKIDLVLTNLTVTHERAQRMRFSYPWYDAGQRIMINSSAKASFWEQLIRSGQLSAYIGLFVLFIGISLALTCIRRRHNPGFTKKWLEGFTASLYDVIITSKSGRIQQNFGWIGYTLASIWMFLGMAVIAYITSTLTSNMAITSMGEQISSPMDLRGKETGVLFGSATTEYLQNAGIHLIPFDNIDMAGKALSENTVKAVVADAPVVEYWAHQNPGLKLTPVGGLFQLEKYAFAGSFEGSLMDQVSLAIIALHEQGFMNDLKIKYFGN
jgi:ABC-type amino acid transport substrate-binding protein